MLSLTPGLRLLRADGSRRLARQVGQELLGVALGAVVVLAVVGLVVVGLLGAGEPDHRLVVRGALVIVGGKPFAGEGSRGLSGTIGGSGGAVGGRMTWVGGSSMAIRRST